MEPRLLRLGDRTLRVRSTGSGAPILYFHGGLGSIHEQPVPDDVIAEIGVQLVLVERPGIGASTRHPGRTLGTWVDDVRAVLDALHLPRAGVVGWAAGVPYALAVAALAPERVTGVSVVGPWFAAERREMDPTDTAALAACREELTQVFAPFAGLQTLGAEALLQAILAQMPEPDRHVGAETRAMLAASYLEGLRNGIDPLMDEGLALRIRWPFALDAVRCAVELWYGDADARALPSVEALAGLPRLTSRVVPGAGHYVMFTRGREILTSLAGLRV